MAAAGIWILVIAVLAAIGIAVARTMTQRRANRHRGSDEGQTVPTTDAAAGLNADTDQQRIGRWIVEREIARGAMGTVWLARQPESGAPAAIKTLFLGAESESDARVRFRREVGIAQKLLHPDIVRVFEAAESGASAWIAMEYVPGRDLSRFTKPGNLLALPVVVHIGRRVALALAYAHERGVVHRDIKPANILVDLATDTIKISDFGIAHLSDGARSRSGQIIGTPSYMAPEQLAGSRADARSDVYALGAMLFQLIAGRLPHAADSMARLLAAIANEDAPNLGALRPDVPPALADVVALALQRRSEMRYASAQQLADDLLVVEQMFDQPSREFDHAAALPDRNGERDTDATPLKDADPRHNAERQ